MFFDEPEIRLLRPQEIRLSRLWIMDWATREIREYEGGKPLMAQTAVREVEDPSPFRATMEVFTYVALHNVPPLPREWISLALFGQDYENEQRPWFAAPKVDLHIDPKEWRTSRSMTDGTHFYFGVGATPPPANALIPLANQWKEAPQ